MDFFRFFEQENTAIKTNDFGARLGVRGRAVDLKKQNGHHFQTVPIICFKPLSWLAIGYLPAMPTLLPTPVTKSQPVFVVKLPAFPDVMSRKSALEQVLAGPVPQRL